MPGTPFTMRQALAGAISSALLLAGCGREEDRPGRTATIEAGQSLRVSGDEYSFDPETVVVRGGAGQPLRIDFENAGILAHNLRLFQGEKNLTGTPTFQGGQSRTAMVTLPAGDYEMVCTVSDHAELGMTGKLKLE